VMTLICPVALTKLSSGKFSLPPKQHAIIKGNLRGHYEWDPATEKFGERMTPARSEKQKPKSKKRKTKARPGRTRTKPGRKPNKTSQQARPTPPATGRANTRAQGKRRATAPPPRPPPAPPAADETLVIKEIMDNALDRAGGELFYVWWEGYRKNQSTWEPAHAIDKACLAAYKRTRGYKRVRSTPAGRKR